MTSGPASRPSPSSSPDALRDQVRRVVEDAGFDLEDLSVQLVGRRRQVRVVVDRDGGVELDRAAELSRALSDRLDSWDAESGATGDAPYTLEVTSPGVGRPLTLPRHFRRAAGRPVRITLADGGTLAARVHSADDTAVHLLTGRSGLEPVHLAFPAIRSARVEVEFNAPSAAVRAALAAPHGSAAAGDVPDGDLDGDGLEDDDLGDLEDDEDDGDDDLDDLDGDDDLDEDLDDDLGDGDDGDDDQLDGDLDAESTDTGLDQGSGGSAPGDARHDGSEGVER
ncbi:ribosome maturation factor RimP [Nakamurella endophytica]|uniref:Ribosome maturation factor RimP n=1 Tax=Nakamurella endophytica TaxID=1748367 RepID=A0A917SSG8_9ACTN|nr:ribosome maturation factor RimP [Nakamurella endophytica]GGL95520.1 hypothetical protein GCM10011594_13940 [Nakamurella endophytica]